MYVWRHFYGDGVTFPDDTKLPLDVFYSILCYIDTAKNL